MSQLPDNPELSELEATLNFHFKKRDRLTQALIHRSYLNENRSLKLESNERLEFLGDAVLETCISQSLFRNFPKLPEGELTNLRALIVCTDNLAKTATSINLGKYIFLSKGEETHQGRSNSSILADTMESVFGAVFIDAGWTKTNRFILEILKPSIQELSQQKVFKDPKSLFQELSQAKRGITPHYQTIKETGPDHLKTFEIGVYLGDKLIATGVGNSKQKAEEDASIKATKILSNLV
jgi:ribonuclease-3